MTRPSRGRYGVAAGAIACLLATTGLTSCSKDRGASPTTTATSTTTTIPVAEPPEVLDAGAAPRRQLRPTMHAGDQVRLRVATDVIVHQTVDGRQQRLDTPPIVQQVALTVTDADDTGYGLRIEIDSVVVNGRDSDLDAERVQALTDQVAPLAGLVGTSRFDHLGRPIAIEIDAPDGLSDSARSALSGLRDQLAHLAPALPEEAVGVGARWTSPIATADGGLDLTGSQTVAITAIDGDRISYEVVIDAEAPAQELSSGDHLTSANATGEGTGWFDLASPAYAVDVTTKGTATSTREASRVEQRTQTVVRVTPQDP